MAQVENTIKVVIYPSQAGEDTLTVSDAMQQVLDYFILLSKAEVHDPTRPVSVVWRLESATTNSPFTVEATAASSDPTIPVDRQALLARRSLYDGLSELFRAEAKPRWLDEAGESAIRRILARNLNGIGRTDIVISEVEPPIVLDKRAALRTQNYLDLKAAEEAAQIENLNRKEHGSIEGNAIGLSTHYRKPALVIRERLSGKEVKCVLSPEIATSVGSQHQWNEVWGNQRIVVSGICHYDKGGDIALIEAHQITALKSRDVSITEIRDPNFSNGLTPQQHLDTLWDEGDG